MKSRHIAFEPDDDILEIVRDLKAVELSDDEPSKKEETVEFNGDNKSGGQSQKGPK